MTVNPSLTTTVSRRHNKGNKQTSIETETEGRRRRPNTEHRMHRIVSIYESYSASDQTVSDRKYFLHRCGCGCSCRTLQEHCAPSETDQQLSVFAFSLLSSTATLRRIMLLQLNNDLIPNLHSFHSSFYSLNYMFYPNFNGRDSHPISNETEVKQVSCILHTRCMSYYGVEGKSERHASTNRVSKPDTHVYR